ncbi:MAG: hypothetical protein H0U85_05960 [Gemmatimonadales bacterium]|nr:hypothetical protein [Gemmatimonadales bacterium]
MVPYHTIAFSQQKLRAALRRSGEQEQSFGYGFVLHSRRQNDRTTLGMITMGGESMALTPRLLVPLEKQQLWLFGHARITLEAGTLITGVDPERVDAAECPLSSLMMHIATFDTSTGVTQHMIQVEATVKAEALVQPMLILTPHRPGGWPA